VRRAIRLLVPLVIACLITTSSAGAYRALPSQVNIATCGGQPAYEPLSIAISCAGPTVVFEATEWESWTATEASTAGVLSYPACRKGIPIEACRTYQHDPAKIQLWRPIHCADRVWLFSRLKLEDRELSDPGLQQFRENYSCPSTRPPRLSTVEAEALMQLTMTKHFESWAIGLGKQVVCNKRVSNSRVKCKVAWALGDTIFGGRGTVWLNQAAGAGGWGYRYKVGEFDEYCGVVERKPLRRCFHIRHGFSSHAG
jgi:hypothetical protein